MPKQSRLNAEEIDKALLDPSSVFAAPEDVLAADGPSKEQKAEILYQWANLVSHEAVAVEEGMPGEVSVPLARVLAALETLVGTIDVERVGPTKAHGLPRKKPES